MNDIKWEEPPNRGGTWDGRAKWAAVANELRANPGQWALVGEDVAAGTVTRIKQGAGAFAPRGAFEAVGGGIKNNRAATVHARYVGEVQ